MSIEFREWPPTAVSELTAMARALTSVAGSVTPAVAEQLNLQAVELLPDSAQDAPHLVARVLADCGLTPDAPVNVAGPPCAAASDPAESLTVAETHATRGPSTDREAPWPELDSPPGRPAAARRPGGSVGQMVAPRSTLLRGLVEEGNQDSARGIALGYGLLISLGVSTVTWLSGLISLAFPNAISEFPTYWSGAVPGGLALAVSAPVFAYSFVAWGFVFPFLIDSDSDFYELDDDPLLRRIDRMHAALLPIVIVVYSLALIGSLYFIGSGSLPFGFVFLMFGLPLPFVLVAVRRANRGSPPAR